MVGIFGCARYRAVEAPESGAKQGGTASIFVALEKSRAAFVLLQEE